jgi:hypothetical protein
VVQPVISRRVAMAPAFVSQMVTVIESSCWTRAMREAAVAPSNVPMS